MACIGAQPIDGAVFGHWAFVAQRAEGGEAVDRLHTAALPPPAQRRRARHVRGLVQETMGFLISSYWVIGEAKDLGIEVPEAQVRRKFDSIRRQQFPRRKEFTAFLRSSGQTIADLLLRVRLNMLSERIQRQIVASQHSPRAQQVALEQFVRGFKAKWSAQTYCAPQYVVPDCGHVQSAL